MKLYEVVFSGTKEERNDDADTIFLVRAHDFRSAVALVMNVCRGQLPQPNLKLPPNPREVLEIGLDLSLKEKDVAELLRGPYMQCAYNYGWKKWVAKIHNGKVCPGEWNELGSSLKQKN